MIQIIYISDWISQLTGRASQEIMTLCLGRARYTKYIGLPTVNILRFAFNPNLYYPSHSANLILSDLDNVRRERTKARLLVRPRDGLWVTYSCNAFIKQSVVKSWCQRRLKRAVLEALRYRGYDRLGRRIGTNGVAVVEEEEEEQGIMNLRGTLEINGFNNLALAEWKEVRRQIGLVVERVVLMCSAPPKSKSGGQASSPVHIIPKEKENKKEGGLQAKIKSGKSVKKRK